MWQKIDSPDSIMAIHAGDTISQHPGDRLFEFKIQEIDSGYVSAVHPDGKLSMKFFHLNYLYYDNWYLKQ